MSKLAYNTANAAAMLDLGRTKFLEVMRANGIKPIRCLGDARWRHADLERLIEGDPANQNPNERALGGGSRAREVQQ